MASEQPQNKIIGILVTLEALEVEGVELKLTHGRYKCSCGAMKPCTYLYAKKAGVDGYWVKIKRLSGNYHHDDYLMYLDELNRIKERVG